MLNWKEFDQNKVAKLALKMFVEENSTKEETKHIQLYDMKMSDYYVILACGPITLQFKTA